ncbi:putative JmjC domain protein [Aspergillus chevalieri]|uniref:JmjC domain-containing protein n=1 Tax=Aspergillus chevalieri TaxID=182096 RepID=A0A7R7ZL17_ASPCH|nr:uncharacterized protein ACHE_20379A [Aspergillus chevalieri]BCR84921.1 hypothetical protein ACHE_20379A [Aspergillus chevalieri]
MKLQKWLLTCHNPRVAPVRAFMAFNHRRSTSSATPSTHRYRPLEPLQNGRIDRFREQYFVPELPAILPRQFFRDIPAVERWFHPATQNDDTPRLRLNTEYLEQHGSSAFVPLELTQPSTSGPTNSELSFRQFHAPLSLFLQWMQTAETNPQQSTRLYLAQCQLSDLPQILRGDFPVPDLVARAGRGDVYDANVWIGHPPTYTPLHRDPNPNLFVQMAGEKVVRLVSPDEGLGLFATVRRQLGKSGNREAAAIRGEEMMQGPERALLEKVVWGDADTWSSEKEGYEARLGPRDGLFIPKGWWHSIKGVGEGVTASVSLLSH